MNDAGHTGTRRLDGRNNYAEPHPELLIPAGRLGAAPAPELLAQLVAVILLLVAWVVVVWVVSSGVLGTSEQPPSMPAEPPAYLSA